MWKLFELRYEEDGNYFSMYVVAGNMSDAVRHFEEKYRHTAISCTELKDFAGKLTVALKD